MEDIKEIDSEMLLETIEEVFSAGGLEAVKNWTEKEFAFGILVNLGQGIENEKVYEVCNYSIRQLNLQGIVLANAYLPPQDNVQNCNLIRVLALPYVSQPFQIELYGKEVK